MASIRADRDTGVLAAELFQVAQALVLCGLPYQPTSVRHFTRKARLADGSEVSVTFSTGLEDGMPYGSDRSLLHFLLDRAIKAQSRFVSWETATEFLNTMHLALGGKNRRDLRQRFERIRGLTIGVKRKAPTGTSTKLMPIIRQSHLPTSWIPALDGVEATLQRGGRVADIGCGLGASTILMAKAYPASDFFGFDYHAESIDLARAAAHREGLSDRIHFEVASAKSFPGKDYDLVAFFDCLHDLGDPRGAATYVHSTLKPNGTWMIVEPYADNATENNLNPVGRVFYSASTMLCVPASLSQEVGAALGAQAGEKRIRDVVTAAGFQHFRRAAQTPFNLVFEARP